MREEKRTSTAMWSYRLGTVLILLNPTAGSKHLLLWAAVVLCPQLCTFDLMCDHLFVPYYHCVAVYIMSNICNSHIDDMK